MFCTQCGQQNPEGSRFCARCGAALPPAPGAPAPSEVETTSTISLAALEGALEGGTGATPRGPTSSRRPARRCWWSSAGPTPAAASCSTPTSPPPAGTPRATSSSTTSPSSRRHAEFVREGGSFPVRDVGSLNGTYLDRERIEAAGLASGDEVQIGKYRLVFLAGPQPGDGA